ncbi:MAG: hypothetical protein P8Y52_00455 [Xanthomonadales bacterium]
MNRLILLSVLPLALAGPAIASADGPSDDFMGEAVTFFDNWPAMPFLAELDVQCPGGEVEWLNAFTPVCTRSGRLRVRDLPLYTCVSGLDAHGDPDPRLQGVGSYELNVNWDELYAGEVWSEWTIALSSDCDPAALQDPQVYWRGNSTGKRMVAAYDASGMPIAWVGELMVVGKGHGGEIEGLHIKGTEMFFTVTPLPLPRDVTHGDPTTPEGIFTGVVFE